MPREIGRIPPEEWGKDHWTLLLYVETVCVDHAGVLGYGDGKGFSHMRCDVEQRPAFRGSAYRPPGKVGNTRLANGEEVVDYDDWDCLDDLEAAGLLANVGTGVNPVIKLTDKGWTEAHRLRRERAERALWKMKQG